MLLAGLLLGGAASTGGVLLTRQDPVTTSARSSTAGPTTPPSEPAPAATTTVAPPPTLAPVGGPYDLAGWTAVVGALGPVTLPSDCPLPLDEPISLPNSERSYRGGVHAGIDFICEEQGRTAVAALGGRVVVANNSFVDPEPADRQALLDDAGRLGRTPSWTLAMLYGRLVVLDHGIVPDVGHVVSLYAHLEEIDPDLRVGARVEAGTRLGEIGNRGTEPAATGAEDPRSLHLHWELHANDLYLGAGLGPDDTKTLYADLFNVPI